MKRIVTRIALLLWSVIWLTSAANANEQYAALYADTTAQSTFLKEKIKVYFPEPNVAEVMIAIAGCESMGNPRGPILHWRSDGSLLPNSAGGQARGMFQVMSKLHQPEMARRGLDINNLDDYLTFARYLYDRNNGYNDWYPSQGCWDPIRLAQK